MVPDKAGGGGAYTGTPPSPSAQNGIDQPWGGTLKCVLPGKKHRTETYNFNPKYRTKLPKMGNIIK